MNYEYVSSGKITISGCAPSENTIYVPVMFKEGELVFEARLARKGRLERLIVKNIIIINNIRTSGSYHINYVDTLNEVYLQEELVNHATAIDLATEYYEKQQAYAIALQNSC